MEKKIFDEVPDLFRLLLENDDVQVMEWRLMPGQKSPRHSHDNHVVYIMTDCKLRFTFPDGKTWVLDARAGEVKWIEAQTHEVENIGTAEARGIAVETKTIAAARKAA